MIKILHISKYYYPYIGGTEQVARDIVNSLKGNNIEQKVICFNADASDGNIMCEKKQDVMIMLMMWKYIDVHVRLKWHHNQFHYHMQNI